jgi:hypothetical protein
LSAIVCASSISMNPPQTVGKMTDPACLGSESANKLAQENRDAAFQVTIGGESVGIYDHPRIWLTPTWITALKAKAVSSNPMWTNLVDANTSNLSAYTNVANKEMLLNFALGYVVSGNTDYLTAAKKIFTNFQDQAIYPIPSTDDSNCSALVGDNGGMDLIYLGAAYDWLAPYLTDGEKQSIRDWAFTQLIPLIRQCHYWSDPKFNLGHTRWIGAFIFSLATAGDDSRGNDLLNERYTFWRDQMAPIFDRAYPGGHAWGGSMYGYNRSYKFALYGMEALTTGTTLNGYEGHPWAVDGLCYRMHSVLPSQDAFHSDGDGATALFNAGRSTENEALLVRRFQGTQEAKFGQFFLADVFRLKPSSASWGGNLINPLYAGLWFLWYDPAYEKESYFTAPTAYAAPGIGLGVSRTSWSDLNSAWTSFSAAPYIGDHQVHNEGSFKIWKNGEYLVIENGFCYAGANANETPPDTNILFVGDGKITQYDQVTGGIYRLGSGTASLSKFSQGTSYAYFVGDLAGAYDPADFPMNSFERIWTHLRPANGSSDDYFVLIDRVDAQGTWRKQQYIHLPYAADVSGKDATMTTAKDKLDVRSVLPGDSEVANVSVSDKTGTQGTCLVQENTDVPSRVTIIEGTPGLARQFFVTAFHVGAPTSAMPATEALTSADGAMKGVLIKDAAQNRGLLVSTTPAAVTGTISFDTTAAAGSEFIVGDLPANQKYNVTAGSGKVTLTPSASGSIAANAKGVMNFMI